MKRKNLIALAVAGACAWPLLATASGDTQAMSMGHWEVAAPSSIDESAPWLAADRSHLGTAYAGSTYTASAPIEVITPSSVDESAPWMTAEMQRQLYAGTIVASAGMPNPHTPWSPNESGANNYAGEMQSYVEHVASVDQAHIAAVESRTETFASGATESEIDRLLLGSSELPAEPGDREQVASVTPGLLDSRQPAMSGELTTEGGVDVPDTGAADASSFSGQQEFDRASAETPTEGGASM
jgi:hypothetical protein